MRSTDPADIDAVEPQEPQVVQLTLGRGKWLSYVMTVLVGAVASGILISSAGGFSLALGSIYFVCVAWIAIDFLYLDVFEIETDRDKCHAKSLLRSYEFDLRCITRVKRSPWPMLFGMRIYRVRFVSGQREQRRLKIISTGDPRDLLGDGQ
jgi:hypothetical protein